jgi:hypothetical protein
MRTPLPRLAVRVMNYKIRPLQTRDGSICCPLVLADFSTNVMPSVCHLKQRLELAQVGRMRKLGDGARFWLEHKGRVADLLNCCRIRQDI